MAAIYISTWETAGIFLASILLKETHCPGYMSCILYTRQLHGPQLFTSLRSFARAGEAGYENMYTRRGGFQKQRSLQPRRQTATALKL